MTMLTMDSCCCCFTLKTGSLIIAYISLMSDILFAYIMIIGLVATHVVMEEGITEEVRSIGAVLFVVIFFDLALVIINLFFNIVLLIGIHQKKRSYVRSYLIASTVFVIIGIIIFPSTIATGASLRNVIGDLVCILVNIYSLLIVRSYLKNEHQDKIEAVEYDMA